MREWIRINADRDLTVVDVSAQFGYNVDYLSRLFSKCYGHGLKAEIEISLSKMETAIDHVQGAADGLNEAANAAKSARQRAGEAADTVNMAKSSLADAGRNSLAQGATTSLSAGAAATATLAGGRLTIGAPRGAAGAKGDTGETGPSDVSFSFDSTTGTLTITTK